MNFLSYGNTINSHESTRKDQVLTNSTPMELAITIAIKSPEL